MLKIVFLAFLLCVFPAAQASDLRSSSYRDLTAHPLISSWTWTLPGKQCSETLRYRLDGTRSGTSAEEVTLARYEVSDKPSLLGFFRLVETTTESNEKRDCSGDLHKVGAEPMVRFIQFSPKRDQFIVCKSEELKACFGPLKRTGD